MDLVAGGTGHLVEFMAAAHPFDTLVVLVTGETAFVLMPGGSPGILAKIEDRGLGLATPGFILVFAARTVACLTLVIRKRRPGVGSHRMFGPEQRHHGVFIIFVVTLQTGIGPLRSRFFLQHLLHGRFGLFRCHSDTRGLFFIIIFIFGIQQR